MVQKLIRAVLVVIAAIIISVNVPFPKESSAKTFTMPALPQPIAKAPVLITSAGQSTDAYILRDIANQLMILNYLRPQAKKPDLEDVGTIVFVVGYSSFGTKLQGISYSQEKERIKELLSAAKENGISILTVAMGSTNLRDKKTAELIELVAAESDYIIGLQSTAYGSILEKAAEDKSIPLTLVSSVDDIPGPFASAFR